jgi:nicotinate phosphoribosyltransferase
MTPEYISYLSSYRYDPSQVQVTFEPSVSDPELGNVQIHVEGLWLETILWEVPLMATLSETYFNFIDTDWNFDRQDGLSFILLFATTHC